MCINRKQDYRYNRYSYGGDNALIRGAYSLYDIFHVYKGASLSSEILKSAPGTAGNADDTVNVEALFNKYPDMRAWLNMIVLFGELIRR